MPIIPAGATSAVHLDAHNFALIPGNDWEIWHSGSYLVGSAAPGGWNVVYLAAGNYNITVPSGTAATSGNLFQFRISPAYANADLGGSFFGDAGHFDVGSAALYGSAPFDVGSLVGSAPFDVGELPYASAPFDVGSYVASAPFDVGSYVASAPFDVGSLVGSAPFDVGANPSTTVYAAPYTLTWTGEKEVLFALRPGVVLAAPLVITPSLTSETGGALTATFSPASLTLTNSHRTQAVSISTAVLGWARVAATHTGYEPTATAAPIAIYFKYSFDPGTPACSAGVDFSGTGRTGAKGTATLSFSVSGTFSKGISGTLSISGLSWVRTSDYAMQGFPVSATIRFGYEFFAYVSGPGLGSLAYQGYDTLLPHDIRPNPDDPSGPPLVGDYFGDGDRTFSGTVSFEVGFDEIKGISGNLGTSGFGEPPSALAYDPKTPIGYPCSYSSSWNWCWGPAVLDPVLQAGIHPSDSFQFGEKRTYTYNDDGSITVTSSLPFSTKYATPHSIAVVSAGIGLDERNPPDFVPAADASFNLSVSDIAFDGGAWSPLPYSGTNTVGDKTTSVTVGDGSFTFSGNGGGGITVAGAARGTAHVEGRVYDGEERSTATNLYVGAGSGYLPVVNGVVSGDIEQRYSKYNGSGWTPAFPATRYDFFARRLSLYDKDEAGHYTLSNDPYCSLLDDVSWPITQASHALTTLVEDFTSIAGWTVTHGVKGTSTPLTVTASDTVCHVHSPTGWNKNFRTYRFLEFDLEADVAGGVLRFQTHSGKYFSTSALKAGRHTYRLDLCRPTDAAGASLTRTGWDPLPDDLYGVQLVSDCTLDGFASGQTVTLHGLNLVRQRETVKGRAVPEQTPGQPYPYTAEWAVPDVPVVNDASPDATVLGLGSGHKRYSRVIAARVDGKQAIDLPHAVQSYPFLDFAGYPWAQVLARDRISICQMIALANALPGLSLSPSAALSEPTKLVDGVVTPVYCGLNPAVFLTFDPGDGLTPGSLDTDLLTTPLLARPLYQSIQQYPGQRIHGAYKFLKRRYGGVEGQILTPDGGSAQSVKVTATSISHPTGETHTAMSQEDGYFRLPAFVTSA